MEKRLQRLVNLGFSKEDVDYDIWHEETMKKWEYENNEKVLEKLKVKYLNFLNRE